MLDDAYWAIPATSTPDLEAALAAAREHWGVTDPQCGTPRFRLIPEHMAIAAGAAWTFNCTIDLEGPERHFVDNCELVVHEFGHLLSRPRRPAVRAPRPRLSRRSRAALRPGARGYGHGLQSA
jgi:hypothetical protein